MPLPSAQRAVTHATTPSNGVCNGFAARRVPRTAWRVRKGRACHKPRGQIVPPVAQNTSHVQSPKAFVER